jgi:hypothetical protein
MKRGIWIILVVLIILVSVTVVAECGDSETIKQNL